jgi:hypothetical protein
MAKQNLHEVKKEFKIAVYELTDRLELIDDKLNFISSIDWDQTNGNKGLHHAHGIYLAEIRDEIKNIVTGLKVHEGVDNE